MPNILISTLGTNFDVVAEALGFCNHSQFDLYANSPRLAEIETLRESVLAGREADELWLIETDRTLSDVDEDVSKWNLVGKYRRFILKGVEDIDSNEAADAFHDMVLRVVRYAHDRAGSGGHVWLSLAGGRKTMSSDLQDAAYCFGCDALLHVISTSNVRISLQPGLPMPGETAGLVLPISLGRSQANPALKDLGAEQFGYDRVVNVNPDTETLGRIRRRLDESRHFFSTYYLERNDRRNFPILYTLSPERIEDLKNHKVGIVPKKRDVELELLREIPKSDLHCHLGGVLDAEGLILVAETYADLIDETRQANMDFDSWCTSLDVNSIVVPTAGWKEYCSDAASKCNVDPCLVNAFIITGFKDREQDLDRLLFGKFTNEEVFFKIDIEPYECLGDMQGSMLLQTEPAIRKVMEYLRDMVARENIEYLELRCSPQNYTRLKLNGESVIRIICEELDRFEIKTSMLLIASRHADDYKVQQGMDLMKYMSGDDLFNKFFRGFDLAGDEVKRRPHEMRDAFETVLRDCRNVTIHAGETDSAESIWDAVYSLSAERVGHGLKLIDDPKLMNKFLERRIGIEMCPSSNYQIVGFADNYFPNTADAGTYPLKDYLERDLVVSVNTDNPGISRTSASNELLRAARLTRDGLSIWDIFQLVYNSLCQAFLPYRDRMELIRKFEIKINELIIAGKI